MQSKIKCCNDPMTEQNVVLLLCPLTLLSSSSSSSFSISFLPHKMVKDQQVAIWTESVATQVTALRTSAEESR